jgi:hypothetical protein
VGFDGGVCWRELPETAGIGGDDVARPGVSASIPSTSGRSACPVAGTRKRALVWRPSGLDSLGGLALPVLLAEVVEHPGAAVEQHGPGWCVRRLERLWFLDSFLNP